MSDKRKGHPRVDSHPNDPNPEEPGGWDTGWPGKEPRVRGVQMRLELCIDEDGAAFRALRDMALGGGE
jgi:hypothetical protein